MRHLMTQRIMIGIAIAVTMLIAIANETRRTRGDRARRSRRSSRSPSIRPNVVLVVTDDQRADSMWVMPVVRRLIGGHGVRFSNAVVSNPFCCPSRATILTGLYSHRTRVYGNGGNTGVGTFARSGAERVTIATALDRAGYRTGLFGKYLNDYDSRRPATCPPGWDRWFIVLGENGAYFNYRTFDNAVGPGSTARRRRTTRPT